LLRIYNVTHVGRLCIEDHVGYGDFDFLSAASRAEPKSLRSFALRLIPTRTDFQLCLHAHGVLPTRR
jgi:hypothetical protein